MKCDNYGSRDIQVQYLKKMYKKYTDHIINMEYHVDKLHTDWVIDTDTRNNLMHKLDLLVRKMMTIYNTNLKKSYKELDNSVQITNTIGKFPNQIQNLLHDNMDIIDLIENKNINDDPFHEIKTELLGIGKSNGFLTMDDFFKLYTNDYYAYLLNKNDIEIFELYNKVFVPVGIDIVPYKSNSSKKNNLSISKYHSKCDSLIDNTCKISIVLDIISTKIIIDGYVRADILNTYLRTSKLCSKYLFNIKQESELILNKNNIDSYFCAKYTKSMNSAIYFANNIADFSEKVTNDYIYYNDLITKNQNSIMKDFFKSNLKEMFRTINILLIGNEQCINTATLLFELLKDKKISGVVTSDIIYKNLSYVSQLKLKYTVGNLKNELSRIKSLSLENISIEKRLASMVNMPDNVKSYILERNNEMKSGENNYKIQAAINGLMQFPWKSINATNEYTNIRKSLPKSRNYLQNVAKKLNENVYGHENSKQVLIELIGKWIQNPESTGQVIGLVGPPGVGKTLLAKSISQALNIPLSIVGLGGMSDAADLIGHSFTYAGAQYGMIIRQMIRAGNWRCVMFFDEVDKVSKRNDTNEIYNTLIHITDPIMNQHFQDRFYSSSIDFDLSGVLVVFSYNSSEKLDPILLDRIKEIEISAYSLQDKISIAKNYIMKELCQTVGFERSKIIISDAIFQYIIENYTVEAGVRELRRKLEQILLKMNIDRLYMKGPFKKLLHKKYLAEHEQLSHTDTELDSDFCAIHSEKNNMVSYIEHTQSKIEKLLDDETINKIFNLEEDNTIDVDLDIVHKYLDKPTHTNELIHTINSVGIVNGLYATSIGIGGIVPIQIYKNYICKPNHNTYPKLKITGNQKQIMKESVLCALTVAINIVNDTIKAKISTCYQNGFHIHAPDGGTPKDGPSAGCAFATAFVSLLLEKKINRYVSMTGEIDLTGKICKIGGLNAKLNGAKKAGIRTVYISEENQTDYEMIKQKNPELFDNSFNVVIVKHIIDIVTNPEVILDIDPSNDFDQSFIKKLD